MLILVWIVNYRALSSVHWDRVQFKLPILRFDKFLIVSFEVQYHTSCWISNVFVADENRSVVVLKG
jgi:hypothetical protein